MTGTAEGATTRLDRVRDDFLLLEAELELFQHEAGGFRMWDHMRHVVFDQLVAGLGLLGEKQAAADRSLLAHLRRAGAVARSLVRYNPWLSRPADLLFVGHARRQPGPDGTWWDVYADPLMEGLSQSSLLVERPHLLRHWEPARTARAGRRFAHLDALSLGAALLRVVRRPCLPRETVVLLSRLEDALHQRFEVQVPATRLAAARLAVRSGQLPLWRNLLRRLRPRLVFLVVSYGNEIVIEACRSLGIPTVELQHGVISPQNLGYHFPAPDCRKQLFPDYLFLFGDFWKEAAAFPVPRERVLSVGLPYLELRRQEAHSPRPAGPQRIVFVSQRSIGRELSRLASQVAGSRPAGHVEILYKLHPGERATWRREYPWLLGAPLQVVEGETPDLYELFAGASLQVGVYSTGLFEGLAFGLPARIVRLPGCAAMTRLVETSAAVEWCEDAEGILAGLSGGGGGVQAPAPEDVSSLFRPGAVENAQAAVDGILEG